MSVEYGNLSDCSYFYRRFIARIEPLRELTRKNAIFQWTPACEAAMDRLKKKLTTAPILAFPFFDREFTVETDASISGLGAVKQDDAKLHPVAYASRSLSTAERNYIQRYRSQDSCCCLGIDSVSPLSTSKDSQLLW